jgi:hypothetical protein
MLCECSASSLVQAKAYLDADNEPILGHANLTYVPTSSKEIASYIAAREFLTSRVRTGRSLF